MNITSHIKKFFQLFLPLDMFIYTYLLIAGAAASNAIMDTIEHHWGTSVVQNWEFPSKAYWERDWTKAYEKSNIGEGIHVVDAYRNIDTWLKEGVDGKFIRKQWFGIVNEHPAVQDGWHGMKVLMIALLLAVGFFAQRQLPITTRTILFYLVVGVTAWILIFNLFYDKILII